MLRKRPHKNYSKNLNYKTDKKEPFYTMLTLKPLGKKSKRYSKNKFQIKKNTLRKRRSKKEMKTCLTYIRDTCVLENIKLNASLGNICKT